MSVEPAMTRFQWVRPMKACRSRAGPKATVYLVGSRHGYRRGPMKPVQLLMKVNTATEARAGLVSGLVMCQ